MTRHPPSPFLSTALLLLVAAASGCVAKLELGDGCLSDADCRDDERCSATIRSCVAGNAPRLQPAVDAGSRLGENDDDRRDNDDNSDNGDSAADGGRNAFDRTTPDAGSETEVDAGTVEIDAGRSDPALTSPSGACTARIRITNSGAAEGALAVPVDLPALAGLRADASNLAITAANGAALPFAIDSASATGAFLFVRIPAFPRGSTDVFASSCDDVAGRQDPQATFDYVLALDDVERDEWSGAVCEGVNVSPELCDAEDIPDSTWIMKSNASCSTLPFDGVRTRNARILPVPAGRYALDIAIGVDAQHFSFCASSVGAKAEARVELVGSAGTTLITRSAFLMRNCETKHQAFEDRTFEFTLPSTPTALQFTTQAGDCAHIEMETWGTRLRRLSATEPRVDVVVDPR